MISLSNDFLIIPLHPDITIIQVESPHFAAILIGIK